VAPLAAGDAVNVNDVPFGSTFPYVPLPSNRAVNQGGASLTGGVETGAGGTAGTPPWVGVGAGLAAVALFVVGAVIGRRTRVRPDR